MIDILHHPTQHALAVTVWASTGAPVQHVLMTRAEAAALLRRLQLLTEVCFAPEAETPPAPVIPLTPRRRGRLPRRKTQERTA